MTHHPTQKILLVLPPFWDPQIPPVGIACLKSVLQQNGFPVKTVDANVEPGFRSVYDRYFDFLKTNVPEDRQGNLFKIGHEVFRNHMMAHLNHQDTDSYHQLVGQLVYHTFYWSPEPDNIRQLVAIIDDFYTQMEAYWLRLLRKENPSVLGVSVFNGTFPASLFAFRLTRTHFPHIVTIMGGGIFADQLAPGSPDYEYFLETSKPYIDKCIVGEGELLLLEYLRGNLPQDQRVYSLDDIQRQFLDLDTSVVPDFSDFDLQHYYNLSMYGSRSCPFQCSFCSETTLWGTFRKKDPHRILEEFQYLQETYGSQVFMMGDCLLNPIITPMSHQLINLDTPVYWDGYLRVDNHACDPDKTLLWRQAGFFRARIGCESGSQHVLDLMGKKVTVQQMKEAIASLAEAGIKTTTMWVIGHPGESEADFQMTLDFIEELKDYIYEADCTPFYYFLTGQPGSNHWMDHDRHYSLYGEDSRSMLITQTWVLDCEPQRDERYRRVSRFAQHLKRLGVPNPFSLQDVFDADQRWKLLRKNAAPSLLEFKQSKLIDECKNVRKFCNAEEKDLDDISFGF